MAYSGSIGSDLLEFGRMSVNTPDVPYSWNDAEKKILQSHREHYYEMWLLVDKLEQDGPEGITLPKKPVGKLESLLGITRESKILSGINLHQYLVKLIVYKLPTGAITCPELQNINVSNLDEILDYLKVGYAGISQNTAYTLGTYLDYGKYLNFAFQLHQEEKWSGKILT